MSDSKRAQPLSDSDDDSDVNLRIHKLPIANNHYNPLKRKPSSKRFTGGLIILSHDDDQSNTTMSLSAAEKKGLKEVEELERELDLKNTFSRETNKRDEDAEMNKYINEKMKLKLQADSLRQISQTSNNDAIPQSDIMSLSSDRVGKIDDILLQSLADDEETKYDDKKEAMLSSQMLNGVPEVHIDGSTMKSNRYFSSRRKH